MDSLHAPWRIEYVLSEKKPTPSGSVFVDIARSSDDEANLVIAREAQCFALLNRYPYSGGHLMVVPYRCVAALEELTDDEMLAMMRLARDCVKTLRRAMNPAGFNVGLNLGKCAGAGIREHIHLHVVPRWEGDTNFMPVLAATNVIPEALRDTAAKLRAALVEVRKVA
jgi:ATP adenylyltransferase